MKKIATLLILFFLASCTYTVNLVHTQGTATDTIDDTSNPTAEVSPTINIPKQL